MCAAVAAAGCAVVCIWLASLLVRLGAAEPACLAMVRGERRTPGGGACISCCCCGCCARALVSALPAADCLGAGGATASPARQLAVMWTTRPRCACCACAALSKGEPRSGPAVTAMGMTEGEEPALRRL